MLACSNKQIKGRGGVDSQPIPAMRKQTRKFFQEGKDWQPGLHAEPWDVAVKRLVEGVNG
jgi:hypothetical protein